MHKQHAIPLEKMEIVNNFLLPEHFAPAVEKIPHRFIYASSPDRGLITLLKMWPEIRRHWDDASLSIFYGWEGCLKLAHLNPSWNAKFKPMRREYEELRHQPGILDFGRVNHQRLALELKQADCWCYPTNFFETGCATAFKAMAGGAVPVCTPLAGLAETGASPWTQFVYLNADFAEHQQATLMGIERALAFDAGEREKMALWAQASWSLDNYALPRWAKLLGVEIP
jgi:hypothetical protein